MVYEGTSNSSYVEIPETILIVNCAFKRYPEMERTIDQAMVQMTLWSIWSAPLIMSNDLRVLKPEIRDILLNRNVIAIDQDPLGIMGKLVRRIKYISIYVKPVTPVRDVHYSYAVAVVNMHEHKDKVILFLIIIDMKGNRVVASGTITHA
nr:alpha-N-acetylgalactosaminidase-like [Haemonchus contortus]